MPERKRRPDYDERFKIETDDPEETLRRLLNAEEVPPDEDDVSENDDSL